MQVESNRRCNGKTIFRFCITLLNITPALHIKRYRMSLKNKRILITAGPTWVAIDSVRVISNIATGETGILLAKRLSLQGAKVTLALGPSCCAYASGKINPDFACLPARQAIAKSGIKDAVCARKP